MTRKSLGVRSGLTAAFLTATCLASQIGFALPVAAQSRDLFAGATGAGELGALPSRAQKSAAPEITLPLKLEAVRNESHPALRTTIVVGEDVLRLVGAGFGREAGGREIHIKVVGGEQFNLVVIAWHDDEVRVQVPDLTALGIDAKQAAAFERELAQGKKRVVGPNVEIGITLNGKWVARRNGQLAVAYRDLDGDGSAIGEDCDDFDPRRRPGIQETYDVAGVDEDCNAATQASAPVAAPIAAPVADPLAIDSLEL